MAHGLQPGYTFFLFPLLEILMTPSQNAHHTELGLERQVFLHELRIFHVVGKDTVQEFDARSVPPKVAVLF